MIELMCRPEVVTRGSLSVYDAFYFDYTVIIFHGKFIIKAIFRSEVAKWNRIYVMKMIVAWMSRVS